MSDIQRMVEKHEKRVRRRIAMIVFLGTISVLPCLLSFIVVLRPSGESFGSWFMRSGAAMAVLGLLAQVKSSDLLEMIRGGTFGESWAMYHKYSRTQRLVSGLSIVLSVAGTIIWGYGDLLIQAL